jgi:hypothetical protein
MIFEITTSQMCVDILSAWLVDGDLVVVIFDCCGLQMVCEHVKSWLRINTKGWLNRIVLHVPHTV